MYKSIYISVIVVVVLAVIVVIAQAVLSQLDFYHRSVVAQLEALTKAQVEVKEVHTTIHDFRLAIALRQLVLSNPQQPSEQAYVEHLRVGISLRDSLYQRRPVITSVALEQAALKLRREASSLHLIGVPTLPLLAGNQTPIHFTITQSSIVWHDAVRQQQLQFADVEADLLSHGMEQQLSFVAALSGDSSPTIHVHADVHGALFSPADWSGRVRAETRGSLAIEPWLPFFDQRTVESGDLSFSADATLHRGRLVKAEGFVVCHSCRHNASALPELVDFSARWQWLDRADGRQKFLLDDIQLGAPPLVLNDAQLVVMRTAAGQRWVDVEIPAMNAATIDWLNRYVPHDWPCEQACVRAQSAALKIRWQGQDGAPLLLAWPATTPLALSRWWADGFAQVSSATATVAMQEATFHSSLWRDYQPHFDHLSAQLQVNFSDTSSRISVRTMRLREQNSQLEGSVTYWLHGDQQARLQLDVLLRDWSTDTVLKVISLQDLPPRMNKLKKWLHASVLGGQITEGRIRVNGDLSRFPFVDGGGQLQAELQIEQGVFSYHNRYPGDVHNIKAQVLFNNEAMQINASQLDYQGLHADRTVIKLPNIFDLLVSIETRGRATLAAIFSFLQQERILRADGLIVQNVELEGEADFDVAIQVPVKQLREQGLSIQGQLRPAQAVVKIPRFNTVFSELSGALAFNRSGSLPSSMTALLNNVPVAVQVAADNGANRVTIDGRLALADLVPTMATMLSTYSTGTSEWRLVIVLPALRKPSGRNDNRYLQLHAESDLLGTALDLPAPLAKSDQVRQAIRLGARFSKSEAHYELAYKGQLHARLRAAKNAPYYAGHIHFGQEAAAAPADRFRVTGAIADTVDAKAWHALLQQLSDNGTQLPWRYYLADINLLFKQLHWRHHRWHDVIVIMKMQDNQVWALRVHEDDINGTIYIPPLKDEVPVLLRFDKLHLQAAQATTPRQARLGVQVDPDRLPDLRFEVDSFAYGDIRADDVKLRTQTVGDVLRLKQLQFHVDNLIVTADLNKPNDWRLHQDQSTTRFSFQAHGDDIGAALRAWNIHTGISNKNSTLRGEIRWRGAPYDFSLAALHGLIELHLQDGVLSKVEPGVGRLFGLLSIASIARRISLDFSDIFKKGLAFDHMRGGLQFRHGTMYTDNFTVLGPAMQIAISGRTGIAARDYDQDIFVVPDLSENLPILTGLLGGPLVGATVFLLDRLTNIGKAIDKTVTLHYRMTGSWEDSTIEFVDAPKVNPMRLDILKKPAKIFSQ